MHEPLSSLASALLQVFRQKGARAGDPLPTAVLMQNAFYQSGPNGTSEMQTALFDLQFRGLIAPGPDPVSATSWMLTPSGDAILKARDREDRHGR